MKRHKILNAFIIALLSVLMVLVACAPQTSTTSDETDTAVEAFAGDSTIGYHQALVADLSVFTDVSLETCTTTPGCHDGGIEALRMATDGFWEGIGQIGSANPHFAHASNAYECRNCHTLSEGPRINQCNGCHNFDSPVGWMDKDSTTTTFGIATEEPLS